MADTKITALTALTAADPANDVIPIVDVSDTTMAASGTTKKISVNNILGASGTATLASATITGDLTVRTNVLKVISTGVGIGTATPNAAYILDLTTANDARARQWIADTGFLGSGNLANGYQLRTLSGSTDGLKISNYANSVEYLRIDSSGNVGVGVVPSAWYSQYSVLQVGIGASISSFNSTYYDNIQLACNYFANSSGADRYINNGYATQYFQYQGSHIFRIASNNTSGANQALTWTPAMTLNASGNLLVGDTSSPIASRLSLFTTFAQPDGIVIRNTGATAGLYWRFGAVNNSNTLFVMNASSVGVTMADGASAWSAVSDERLKDIIEPISNAVSKIGSLRSVIGKYKSDADGMRRSFLIAQDVKSVLPEAVDATDSESLGLRYTEVIPLLVAAIKELTARVEALEA